MANEKIVNRENLKAFRQAYDERLKKGTIVPAESLTAIDFKPVSKESGSVQETPFINQGTATNNNDSQAEVDTGKIGEHWEKQGNSVVVNQLARELSSTYWNSANATVTYSNGIATFTASAQNGQMQSTPNYTSVAGHKYLVIVELKLTTATTSVYVYNNVSGGTQSVATKSTTDWQSVYVLATAGASGNSNILVRDSRSSDWDAIQVRKIKLHDITQWFNGDIPSDLLTNPEHWSWYDNTDGSYNTGTLTPSNGRYLECGQGRNIWDEQWEQGSISTSTGENTPSTTKIRSKNFCLCIPNRNYYFYSTTASSDYVYWYDKNKNFIKPSWLGTSNTVVSSPSNAWYFKIINAGTTYANNITVSLYYPTGDGYDKYYPYVAPKVYDTGNEVLRKAGSVKDTKDPDGTIHRRIGTYTFTGSETWVAHGQGFRAEVLSGVNRAKALANNNSVPTNLINDIGFNKASPNAIYDGATNSISANVTNILVSSTTGLVGKTICFEAYAETTEQGTPFTETIEIDDMSNMAWYDTNVNLVYIPQGCKIFYPAWYSGFVDSLGQREDIDWSAEKVVSQDQLVGYVKQTDLSSEITDKAGLTYSYKKAYKVGNVVTVCIRATNSTGSTIASGTELFTLGSGLLPIGNLILCTYLADNIISIGINYQTGKCSIDGAFANNSIIIISGSYVVS